MELGLMKYMHIPYRKCIDLGDIHAFIKAFSVLIQKLVKGLMAE